MNAAPPPSLFDRPLRPDLAAFFTLARYRSSSCAAQTEKPLVGILAELARNGLI
jgi:hypothetical protein